MNNTKHLIYCPVFKDELRFVLDRIAPDITCHELGYDVHNYPATMFAQLSQGIQEAVRAGRTPCILVGKDCECTVPIAELARDARGCVPGYMNCFEIYLGKEKTLELQKNRTVLMTPGWITMIQTTLAAGLWTVEDARMHLGWYDRILLLNTQVVQISDEDIMEFYDIVQVPIEVQDIDLNHFQGVVEALISCV